MANNPLEDLLKGIDQAQGFLNNNTPLTQTQAEQFRADGFALPAAFNADGTGLPFSKVQSFRDAKFKRNIMTWFVPQFGIVRMPINPERLTVSDRKLINRDRTKGGWT